ncbi:glycosyltransferase family 2 protein [Candidatus Woesearchaeota archaeon]|nr:glycosyltransferase family 2 protein [Candidatus Woesearchaeota archaeon]
MLVLFSSKEEELRGVHDKKLEHFPMFTAIVPAYNEEESIRGTLTSLAELEYPLEKKEIIVVNDGSHDGTQKIVEDFIAAHPEQNITLINQENSGKGRALNVALEIAKGEFFACLDADSFVSKEALQVMLPLFYTDEKVAAVCPLLKVKRPKNILQKVQWYEYIINMFYRSLNARIDCVHVTPGPFSMYKTAIIRKIGGYDETTITEDLEIAIRMQKFHYRILQTFETSVETVTPQNWKALFRQRVRWYKGSIDNAIVYRKLAFNKKYGDFGMLRMPTMVFSGVIAVVLAGTLIFELFKALRQWFSSLVAVNFDIMTLIKTFTINFNILSLPFSKMLIASTLFCISIIIMVMSFRNVRERITNYGKTWMAMFTYIFIYSIFMSTVWMYIAFMFVSRKKNFWM